MPPALDAATFTGPLAVTLAYVALYYAFQLHVMRVKMRLASAYAARRERFDRYFGEDREMLAADRIQLNMLEHMGPFLALLWLHALFVAPGSATIAGAIYVVARATYPFNMGRRLGRGIKARLLLTTAPGYLVLAYFLGSLLWTVAGA